MFAPVRRSSARDIGFATLRAALFVLSLAACGSTSPRATVGAAVAEPQDSRADTVSDVPQLANGDQADASERGDQGPAATAIAVSHSTVLARMNDGTIRGWGAADAGQLGFSSTTDVATPVEVAGVPLAIEIGVGGTNTHGAGCAVTGEGELWCWGTHPLLPSAPLGKPQPPTKLYSEEGLHGLSVGYRHGCAIRRDRRVVCWGDGSSGGLGPQSRGSSVDVTLVDGLVDVEKISAGVGHTCALHRDGHVSCLGNNDGGQSDPSPSAGGADVRAAKRVDLGAKATDVAALDAWTCVVLEDGALACWGRYLPGGISRIKADRPFVALAQGVGAHACAIMDDATMRCFGDNEFGQLGDGTTSLTLGSVELHTPTDLREASAAAVSGYGEFTCAVLAQGDVSCWGSNAFGNLGDGTLRDHATPARVPLLRARRLPAPVDGSAHADLDVADAIAGTPPQPCEVATELEVRHSGDLQMKIAVKSVHATRSSDGQRVEVVLRDHSTGVPNPCWWRKPRGSQICVEAVFTTKDEYEEKVPGTQKTRRVVRERAVKTGEFHPSSYWLSSNQRTRRLVEARLVGSRLVQGVDPTPSDTVDDSTSVTLTHLDGQWACGTFKLAHKRGAIRGAFAAPIVSQDK